MYPILLFTWWWHTRVNRLDTEVAAQFPSAARHGHFRLDFVFAVWPWRVYQQPNGEYGWPAHLITVDVGEVLVKTMAPGEVYLLANPAIAFRWGPDLRRALNILDTSRVQIGGEGNPRSVDPANDDGTLTAYLEPWILGALRNVVAQGFTFGVDQGTDVNANIDNLRDAVLEHLAQPEGPFAQLGLLELVEDPQPGERRWKLGVSGRTFELEIPHLLPQEGTDLAKAIGAKVVAERRAEQRGIEADAEANYKTRVGAAEAEVEGLKTRRVGEGAAVAVRARIDAETAGIEEQMKKLGRKKGLTPAAVLDAMTTRSAAQAGGTMIMVSGLASAAEAVTKVVTGQKE